MCVYPTEGRIAVRSVHRTHLKGYYLIKPNLHQLCNTYNELVLIVLYIRRRSYTVHGELET
jgi:hypothetical protein